MRLPRAVAAAVGAATVLVAAWAWADAGGQGGSGGGAMPHVSEPVGPLPGPVQHTPAANPFAGDRKAATKGRHLFVHFNCAGCHGEHGGGGMGPSLRDSDWIYGGEDGDIFDSIAQGRAHGMPAWGRMLPTELIWQIVAYIDLLETDKEIEPPRDKATE